MKDWSRLAAIIFALTAVAPSGQATVIAYEASDLVDVTPGEDLWRYRYTLSEISFSVNEGFSIFFDPVEYGTLSAGPSPSADWDTLILQQPQSGDLLDPFADGIYDVLALVADPNPLGLFSVDFVFLGTGVPGSQQFEVYDSSFAMVESGITTSGTTPIPEPGSMGLLLGGLLVMAARLRQQGTR